MLKPEQEDCQKQWLDNLLGIILLTSWRKFLPPLTYNKHEKKTKWLLSNLHALRSHRTTWVLLQDGEDAELTIASSFQKVQVLFSIPL